MKQYHSKVLEYGSHIQTRLSFSLHSSILLDLGRHKYQTVVT